VRRFVAFPFQALDKAFLAGTQAPWASFAPVWRLEYRGALTEEQLVRSLGWVLARYPWCAARVEKESAWVLPESIDPRSQFSVLDLRGAADPEREAALADRFLALEREAPFTLTWVRRADDAGVLVFQQHHSLADGRAFLALVSDFVRCLDATASPLASGIVPRLPEREALPERGFGAFVRGALHTLGELILGNVKPLTPLFSNRGTDYSGSNRTRHLFVASSRLEAWRERRVKLGLSVNDLLAGALCVALSRWSAELGSPPGLHNLLMPIDVRPREGFESFANHLSTLQLRWRGREARPIELARELQRAAAPLLAARLPWKRILFDGFMMLATPMALLRKTLLVKRQLLTNYSFSNLVPLGTPGAAADGRWRTGSIVIERLLITTPCTPPQAANTTVVRYGDDVCFNFNFKDSALRAEEVERLTAEFSRALDEVEQDLAKG
jgi:hypothetical protein